MQLLNNWQSKELKGHKQLKQPAEDISLLFKKKSKDTTTDYLLMTKTRYVIIAFLCNKFS